MALKNSDDPHSSFSWCDSLSTKWSNSFNSVFVAFYVELIVVYCPVGAVFNTESDKSWLIAGMDVGSISSPMKLRELSDIELSWFVFVDLVVVCEGVPLSDIMATSR